MNVVKMKREDQLCMEKKMKIAKLIMIIILRKANNKLQGWMKLQGG